MSEIKAADGTVIVERWNLRYELATSQLGLLPPITEDDEYEGLRFSCEEVKQLIEELSRAEAQNRTLRGALKSCRDRMVDDGYYSEEIEKADAALAATEKRE